GDVLILSSREIPDYGDADSGCALCFAAVAKDSGIHGDGVADAGAGDWGELGDLYAGEYGVAEGNAGGGPEDASAGGRHERLLCWLWDARERRLLAVFDGRVRADEEERAGV